MSLGALGLAWFARVPEHGDYLVSVLPALVVLGLGIGGSFPALMALAMAGAGPEDAGLASGLVNTTAQVGGRWAGCAGHGGLHSHRRLDCPWGAHGIGFDLGLSRGVLDRSGARGGGDRGGGARAHAPDGGGGGWGAGRRSRVCDRSLHRSGVGVARRHGGR